MGIGLWAQGRYKTFPGLHAAEAIIRGAGQRHHIEVAFHEFDGRHKQVAVKAVLVELAGRQVGSGDNDRAVGQQGLEQAAHNHRIGNVADLHFIEAQNLRLFCQVRGDLRHHIGFAERLAAPVNVLHEGMEVDALLGLHLQVCKKQIHQHGFAAAHVAINVDALGRAVLVQESSDGAALFTGLKRLGQVIEM